MDDKTVRQAVIDQLDWDPRVDSASIGVAADKGIVTLTGHVPSYAQLVAAESAVKHVKGVRGVVQNIEVRFKGAGEASDEDIVSRALTLLNWDVLLPKDAIQVEVAKGWLTLTGQVEWQYQRQNAEKAIRGLAGVKGVSNLITVKSGASATDIVRDIEEALRRDARLEAEKIKVSVDDGKVKLEGHVHSWHEREAIEQAVWNARGVRWVEDKVSIR